MTNPRVAPSSQRIYLPRRAMLHEISLKSRVCLSAFDPSPVAVILYSLRTHLVQGTFAYLLVTNFKSFEHSLFLSLPGFLSEL